MTDIDQPRDPRELVRAIVAKVALKTAVLAGAAAAGSAVYGAFGAAAGPWWLLPVSVLFGAALGLVNFRWLATTVERYYARAGATKTGATVAGLIVTLLKLSSIFVILLVVIKWHLLHIMGLVGGLSLCFLAILWEGAAMMTAVLTGDRESGNSPR